MISINFAFWLMVILFGLIGMMRGWAKELLVSFSVILALAFNRLLERYVPVVNTLPTDGSSLFWVRIIIVITLVFFGYQTVALPRFASKAAREKLQDSLLGFVLGALNGYFVIGTAWFYLDMAKYPFSTISAPVPGTAMGEAALNLIPMLAPRLLGEPAIYFAVMLCFIFVLVVFI
ncbi:MAG: CvpA family protein [Chloroflexi bacterium]|nr:CvpA family protein [Chloroflexota bacterium]